MNKRPKIWNKFDKRIEKKQFSILDGHKLLPVGNEEWEEYFQSLSPIIQVEYRTVGWNKIFIMGQEIPCMAYKTSFAVVKNKYLTKEAYAELH